MLRKPGTSATREEILDYLAGEVAKWWLPDDVVFVDELPHTATGKVLKLKLREQYRDHALPEALPDLRDLRRDLVDGPRRRVVVVAVGRRCAGVCRSNRPTKPPAAMKIWPVTSLARSLAR